MIARETARKNRLLALLPEAAFQRWWPELQEVDLPLGTVLRESGLRMSHAVFPTTAIVCLVCLLENGSTTEIAVVGREGLVAMPLLMGGGSTSSRAVVKSAGRGLRLRADFLLAEFHQHREVMDLLLQHTQALMTQMSQSAVCNRHHALDQQLCRWLLLWLDRTPGSGFAVTQELIAGMLGVRRAGVTEAAGKLSRDGVIEYRRGHVTVLDRAGLEQRACECYGVVRREYDRLLSSATATATRR